MIKVSKSVLKAKMLEYFRIIEKTGEEIIVTSNQVPVIKILPIKRRHPPKEVFQNFQGKMKYSEDVMNDTSSEWTEL